jgi:hypothetical protein
VREIKRKLHYVPVDGLPDMNKLAGRVAFIFDLPKGIENTAADDSLEMPPIQTSSGPAEAVWHEVEYWIELPERAEDLSYLQ